MGRSTVRRTTIATAAAGFATVLSAALVVGQPRVDDAGVRLRFDLLSSNDGIAKEDVVAGGSVLIAQTGQRFRVSVENELPERIHVALFLISPTQRRNRPEQLLPGGREAPPGSTVLHDIEITPSRATELFVLCWSREPMDDSELRSIAAPLAAMRDHLPANAPLEGANRRNANVDVTQNVVPHFYYLVTVPPQLVETQQERYELGARAFELEQQGQLADAQSAYQRAIAIGVAAGIEPEASTLNQLGQLHARTGRPGTALTHYRTALAKAVDERNERAQAVIQNNLADILRNLGYFDESLARFRATLELPVVTTEPMIRAVANNNIGLVLMQRGLDDPEELELAEQHFREALDAYQEEESRQLRPPSEMALSRSRAGSTTDGALMRRFAVNVAVSGDNPYRAKMVTRNNLGRLLLRRGFLDRAREQLRLALEINDELGGDPRTKAVALMNLGQVEEAAHQPQTARALYHRALELQSVSGDWGATATAHQNLGQFLQRSGELEESLEHYALAAAARTRERSSLTVDADRLSSSEQDVGLYAGWALAWLALGRENDGGDAAALFAAERGRAQALLELMLDSQEPSNTNPQVEPSAMATEGRDLVRRAFTGASVGLFYLVTRDKLIVWLLQASGDVHVAEVEVSRSALAELVRRLRSGMGVDEAARDVAPLEPRGVVGASSNGTQAEHDTVREELSQLLVPRELRPHLPTTGELVVLPDAAINLVPFAMLSSGSDGERLGERFAIRYAPSLEIAAAVEKNKLQSRSAPADRRSFLVVGNPAMPTVSLPNGTATTLPSLSGAEREGEWVANQLGTTVLTSSMASETKVRERLAQASIIHLATHGFAFSSSVRARESFIALAPDDQHDGLLTVGEILDEIPSFSAELVTLSACQTGLGNLNQAEGTVGLQRAFLAKGARSVLVSLWSVSDTATALLMRSFYRHWREDEDHPSKAEALRRAQDDLRGTPGFEHPKFWAAFQLVGA